MSNKVYSEDEIGRKWDRCITDGVLKLAGGGFLGTVFSLLFFRRRKWPIVLGMGFGIGMAYSNCEHEMNTIIDNIPKSTSEICPPEMEMK